MNKQIKIKFLSDCDTTKLALWTLNDAMSKDNSFLLVNTVEEADLVIASRYYWITNELDRIKSRKLIYISYALVLKDYPILPFMKLRKRNYYRDYSSILWKLFSPTPNFKQAMKDFNIDTSDVTFLGYPEMDLINYNYNTTLKSLGLKNKKTVLYAPTIGYTHHNCFSSYIDYIDFIVYLSLKYDFNLIIRPHPNMLDLEFKPDIKIKLDNINKLDNIYIDYSWNPYPIFKLIDFTIGDVSGITYKALTNRKPVILIQNKPELLEQYQDYESIMYTIKNHTELENRVELLLNECDSQAINRTAFVDGLPKNSTELIRIILKKILKELINENCVFLLCFRPCSQRAYFNDESS